MLQPVLLLLRLAHALGGTGGNQGRKAGRGAGTMRLGGLFQGLPETTFKEQTNGILKDQSGAFTLALCLILANTFGQAEGNRQRTHSDIKHKQDGQQDDDEEIERNLRAPWRDNQQDVTVVGTRS